MSVTGPSPPHAILWRSCRVVVCTSSILIKVPFHGTEYTGQTYKHDPSTVVIALFFKAFGLEILFDKHFRCLCKPGG
jgi:hypothetical protein